MAPDELRDAVLYQLGALDAFAQVGGAQVAYVKPHGALYHAVAGRAFARRRRRGRRRRVRPVARHPGPAGFRTASRLPMRPGWKPCQRRSPIVVPARRRSGLATGGGRRADRSETRSPHGRSGWRSTTRWSPSTARSSAWRRARSACTETRQAPSRSRDCGARCARRGRCRRSTVSRADMQRRSFGPAAWLIDESRRTGGVGPSTPRSRNRGVTEIVPAERTVLVVCDRSSADSIGPLPRHDRAWPKIGRR